MNVEDEVEELSNEYEHLQKEQIESDFEDFLEYTSDPNIARRSIIATEKLLNILDDVERESIKSDLANLIDYSVPVEGAAESVRRKHASRSSSGKNNNDSTSDYKAQIRDNYPENWDTLRKQAYERDNYYCRNCGVGGGTNGDAELHAHHVVPVSAGGNHTLSNLYTLCETCHSLIHDHLD